MPIDLTRRDLLRLAAITASTPLVARAAELEQRWATLGSGPGPFDAVTDIDRDLLEVTVDKLHAFYDDKKYTATQVTRWYLDRIARYDRVYRAMIHVDTSHALATAATLDALPRRGKSAERGALWGVPIVIKANTSIKGLVTSAGWAGYLIPGHELVAPKDATIVAKLKAAGAIILGQTNMPDFAASDTNVSSAFGRTGNAYNWRCSPGGSSGGTVTAVTANYCVLGNGTDTGNSIRMPSATSAVVGVLPTRGLVSIAGINPLDWLRDNTGPIARDVTDAAIALSVMQGEDAADFRTKGSAALAQSGSYTARWTAGALEGKRFGVPAFIVSDAADVPLQPDARDMFTKSLDGLRAAGATVVQDDAILPASFMGLIRAINTSPYSAEGVESFLRDYGPPDYHSGAEYARVVGNFIPLLQRGAGPNGEPAPVKPVESDPDAESQLWAPQRRALAAYEETLNHYRLDGYVYPAAQMQPPDEIALLDEGKRSGGPHSETAWINPIGTPAISIPGGFYASGLPFGVEIATRRWRDGDLLSWAYAYEQATHHRKPPVLVETRDAARS